ncbi:MAG: HAD-IB family hydrolase, partial [Actinobacteria bacterium]|nr:HAD-IB family hydrolase [Actinomycetota bacterium]
MTAPTFLVVPTARQVLPVRSAAVEKAAPFAAGDATTSATTPGRSAAAGCSVLCAGTIGVKTETAIATPWHTMHIAPPTYAPSTASRSVSRMAGAAFIDLDRTLLSGASGPAISAALRAAKLVPASVPGESLLYKLFNTVGETLPSMLLARQGATAMKGKSRRIVREAVATAIPELTALVQPFARAAIEQHRADGDKVVLATTSPFDFVEEFARSVGFDDVIATRYEVDSGGLYTGELDGRFVWSGGKLASVRDWCAASDINIADCAAYTDSIYDSPLLEAVGKPHAVNPDARLQVLATARRWPVMHFDVSPGVGKVPVIGTELQRLALNFSRPEFIPFAKFTITGTENIPTSGPAIL